MARRTKEEARETRENLLESALDVMSEKPFSSVSMNEIAERIGLSKGAIYWHFKNKNDILINLVENLCSQAEKELQTDTSALESLDCVRLYFKNKMVCALRCDRVKKINMLMQRRTEWPDEAAEKVFAIVHDRARREQHMIKELLEKAQSEGGIRNDISSDELASLITIIFHGFLFFQLNELYPLNFAKYTDFIMDAFAKELKPRGDAKINNEEKEKVL